MKKRGDAADGSAAPLSVGKPKKKRVGKYVAPRESIESASQTDGDTCPEPTATVIQPLKEGEDEEQTQLLRLSDRSNSTEEDHQPEEGKQGESGSVGQETGDDGQVEEQREEGELVEEPEGGEEGTADVDGEDKADLLLDGLNPIVREFCWVSGLHDWSVVSSLIPLPLFQPSHMEDIHLTPEAVASLENLGRHPSLHHSTCPLSDITPTQFQSRSLRDGSTGWSRARSVCASSSR